MVKTSRRGLVVWSDGPFQSTHSASVRFRWVMAVTEAEGGDVGCVVRIGTRTCVSTFESLAVESSMTLEDRILVFGAKTDGSHMAHPKQKHSQSTV